MSNYNFAQNYIAKNKEKEKIIWLPREPLGRYVGHRTLCGRRLVRMITYDELFNFVIMLCAVITLVIYIMRKK